MQKPGDATPVITQNTTTSSSAATVQYNKLSTVAPPLVDAPTTVTTQVLGQQNNIFLDVVDAFQNYIGNKLSIVEQEIQQAEDDIKTLQAKLGDISANHQDQEVHIFQTIRKSIAHLQTRQSSLTEEVRSNREHMTRTIKE